MKTEIIKQLIKAYEENDLEKCETQLLFLMLSYNTDIREGKPYDHNLKHILFKTNCIHNPIGIKNSFCRQLILKRTPVVLLHNRGSLTV
ncbi:hypothetical protein D3Z51_15275 [Clostridiaceae bacterium]|nr:hypothetical protein [Clostridiaceae bacterium]